MPFSIELFMQVSKMRIFKNANIIDCHIRRIKRIKSHIAQPSFVFLFSDVVYIQKAENVQTDDIKMHGYNCQ